ncbi:MAG: DNA-directed RNA polymerase subunit N [Thermoplasmata archaeon]|nr:DNA-directed RNA polymerase subunit N [Thermoplasmata archaeon]
MIIPVRCFTCGKVIGSAYEIYRQRVDMGEKPNEVLDSLGVTRYCCRRMIISQVDLLEETISFG